MYNHLKVYSEYSFDLTSLHHIIYIYCQKETQPKLYVQYLNSGIFYLEVLLVLQIQPIGLEVLTLYTKNSIHVLIFWITRARAQ